MIRRTCLSTVLASTLIASSGCSPKDSDGTVGYRITVDRAASDSSSILAAFADIEGVGVERDTVLTGLRGGRLVEKTSFDFSVPVSRRENFVARFKDLKKTSLGTAYLEKNDGTSDTSDIRRVVEFTLAEPARDGDVARLALRLHEETALDDISVQPAETTFVDGTSRGRISLYATVPDDRMPTLSAVLARMSKEPGIESIELSTSPRYVVPAGKVVTVHQK